MAFISFKGVRIPIIMIIVVLVAFSRSILAGDDKLKIENDVDDPMFEGSKEQLATCPGGKDTVKWHMIDADLNNTKLKPLPSKFHPHYFNSHIDLPFDEARVENSGVYACCPIQLDNYSTEECDSMRLTVFKRCSQLLEDTSIDKLNKSLLDVQKNEAAYMGGCGTALSRLIDVLQQLHNMTEQRDIALEQLHENHTERTPDLNGDQPQFTLVLASSTVHAGEQLNISCNVSNSQQNWTFSWYWKHWEEDLEGKDVFDSLASLKNLEGVNNTGQSNSFSNITIWKAALNHSGWFVCIARSDGGTSSTGVHTCVTVENPIKKDLSFKVNGKEVESVVVVPYNTTLNVSCTAEGEYTAPYSVSITASGTPANASDEQPLSYLAVKIHPDVDQRTNTTVVEYEWDQLKSLSSVAFKCEAIGDFVSDSKTSSTRVTIELIPLNITTKTEERTAAVEKGGEAVLNCTAEGNPPPTNYSWNVDCTNTPKYTCKGGVLTIKEVKDDDYESYTCTAGNGARNVSAVFTVLKPKGPNGGAPPTPTPTDSATVSADASQVTTATATSDPKPTSTVSPTTAVESVLSPTVIGAILTVAVLVLLVGGLYLAYRSRYTIRDWIMSKDFSKSALRKAKYARKGGKGLFKYTRLPRDITEAVGHND